MGKNELEKRILSSAKEEVKAIEAEAEKQSEELLDRFRARASNESADIISSGGKESELEFKRIVGAARVSARRRVSEEKSRLLDEFFAETRKEILSLPDARKKKLLAKLFEDASFFDARPKARVSQSYAKLAPKGFKLVKDESMDDFGVVLESEDGLTLIDNRLKLVLAEARKRLEPDINKTLWG